MALARLRRDAHLPAAKAQSDPQVSVEPLVGPAAMWRTRTPGSTSTIGASAALVRRVKMSTAMPLRASRFADSRT